MRDDKNQKRILIFLSLKKLVKKEWKQKYRKKKER